MTAKPQPSQILLLIGGFALASVVAWSHRDSDPRPTSIAWSDSELRTEIYVWQRQWTTAVEASFEQLAEESPTYCALGLEFGFDRQGNIDGVESTHVDWDLAADLAEQQKLSFAVRIHHNPAGWTKATSAAARNAIQQFHTSLGQRGIAASELQVDYDCPQSKLADYANFLTDLRNDLPSQKLTVTALPSWLGEAEFPDLIDATDGYVLQVHSLSLPQAGEPGKVVLCDTGQAMHDIQRAARIGRPFRVALPTYSSIVLFDSGGTVVDVVSEDLDAPTPRFSRAEFAHANENEIADLVAKLETQHPATMQGIIWYRLPVATDRMNWPMAAFRRVLRGERPLASREIEMRTDASSGAVSVVLVNCGETAIAVPDEVRIMGARFTNFDGLAGYRCSLADDLSGVLLITARNKEANLQARLRPGEELHLAWLRHEPGTLSAHICE